MLMEPDKGPEIEINLVELDIMLDLAKLADLGSFWNYNVNNPGLKTKESKNSLHLTIIIPRVRFFIRNPSF